MIINISNFSGWVHTIHLHGPIFHSRGNPGYCGAAIGAMRIHGPAQVKKRKHNRNEIHTVLTASIPEYPALMTGRQHSLKECMRILKGLSNYFGELDTFEMGEFGVA